MWLISQAYGHIGRLSGTTTKLFEKQCYRQSRVATLLVNNSLKRIKRTSSSSSSSSTAASSNILVENGNDKEVVRLNKRMSQLDMCSRREADEYISNGQVLVKGKCAQIGQKVAINETDIKFLNSNKKVSNHYYDAVVLYKPRGYVSGQPEDGKVPAVRLLTPENQLFIDTDDDNSDNDKYDHRRVEDQFQLPFQTRRGPSTKGRNGRQNERTTTTLHGYAPAGRLDQDSSGLLVFCKSGVLAKKLVSADGIIRKEYIVEVEEAKRPSKKEKELGITELPKPTLKLTKIRNGGLKLAGEKRRLRSSVVEWIEEGRILRFVLSQGQKRQIRRMCREILGYHVKHLHRTRIGPIKIDGLEPGKWRLLQRKEVDYILAQ